MNDRYLFRAKRIDNGEWVEGSLFAEGKITKIIRGTCNTIGIEGVDVNPETICQCTGLKDKNGNQIWENDIIECFGTVDLEKHFLSQVGWDNDGSCFLFQDAKYSFVGLDSIGNSGIYSCEVIGNIFDNPELINE